MIIHKSSTVNNNKIVSLTFTFKKTLIIKPNPKKYI